MPVDLDAITRGIDRYHEAMNRNYTPEYMPDLTSFVSTDEILEMVTELREARSALPILLDACQKVLEDLKGCPVDEYGFYPLDSIEVIETALAKVKGVPECDPTTRS